MTKIVGKTQQLISSATLLILELKLNKQKIIDQMRLLIKRSKEQEKLKNQQFPRVNHTQNAKRNQDLNIYKRGNTKIPEIKVNKRVKLSRPSQVPTSFQHHAKFSSIASKFKTKPKEFQRDYDEMQKEIEEKLSIEKIQQVVGTFTFLNR